MAASFQAAAVDILVEKTVLAAATYRTRTVLVAGGVAANRPLRERLRERLGPDIDLRYPPLILCTDNAAMIAAAAYFRYAACCKPIGRWILTQTIGIGSKYKRGTRGTVEGENQPKRKRNRTRTVVRPLYSR